MEDDEEGAEEGDVLNLAATATAAVNGVPPHVQAHVHSDLLCFVQRKCTILAFDDLVRVCSDFYSLNELEKARLLLTQYISEKRLPKPRSGTERDKARKRMIDIAKVCLDPSVQLPQFYAVDLRLPSVGTDHVDVSAILEELSSLRQEVRGLSHLRVELEEVKAKLQAISAMNTHCCDDHSASGSASHIGVEHFPPLITNTQNELTTESRSSADDLCSNGDAVQSFAVHARRLRREGLTSAPATRVNNKQSRKPVFGKSTSNKVKSVITRRTVDVFVSRLHPQTKDAEIVDTVKDIYADLAESDIQCNRLKPRYEHLYCSFHVAITVDTEKFQSALEIFMSPDSWPLGTLVKRYFRPKDDGRQ